MGAGYSSPFVDSNLVFPAPPPSYAADTDDLLWLHCTSVAECAVPGFLITPKASHASARSPVPFSRQESQQQRQQTRQRQQEHREQKGAQQQEQELGHCDENHYEARHGQRLRDTCTREEPTSRELQWRNLQQEKMQQCQPQTAGGPQHQQSSRSEQCWGLQRQSSLQQHMFERHLPEFEEQLFQARRQGCVFGVQRASLLQHELQAAPVCASMPRLVRKVGTSSVCSRAAHPRKLSSASDAVAMDGASDCCNAAPNATSNARTAKEGNRMQQHETSIATGKGAVEDTVSLYAHAASTPGEQACSMDGPWERYDSPVSDPQQQEHLEEEPNQLRQRDKQSKQRPRVLTLRRSLSWSSIPGRSHKCGQGFCMLYFHGNACDANMMRGWLQVLADEVGLTILIFEYPGYGLLNREDKSSRGVDLCARVAFEYIVESLHYPIEKIILCGRSIGTGAAAWLARELGGSGLYVGGVVLIAPFVSLAKVAADWTDAPVTLMQVLVHNHWNTEDALRCIPNVPVCIIHGKRDDVIPVAHSKCLTASAPRPPWLRVIHLPETAGHDVGLTPSSLLLDVVAPLQLFLSKVAAASLRRNLDARQLHESVFQGISSARRCRIPMRVLSAYRHNNEHHQQAASQQQQQQRMQEQHLQLHLHGKEVHSQVKRVPHSLPVHARRSRLRCVKTRGFSAFLAAAGDSRGKGRPLRGNVQKHLLRFVRHRRKTTSSRRLQESIPNRCAPQSFPSDFLMRSCNEEKSAKSSLFPCHSARHLQQIWKLQHDQKQRQCHQRPPRDSCVKDTERSQVFYIDNYSGGVKRRGQTRAFDLVRHCSFPAHVPPGHIRCPPIPRRTIDHSKSSGALRSRVISVSLEPPACTERMIFSEAPYGFRITAAAEATHQQVVHVTQEVERGTAEGGKGGKGQKHIEKTRERRLRTERERKVQPPQIRYPFLSCTLWDEGTIEQPRRFHALRASCDVLLEEKKKSKFLDLCRASGQSACTPAQHPTLHAWSLRPAEDVVSAPPRSMAPCSSSRPSISEQGDRRNDVDYNSAATLARAYPCATKKADRHAWPSARTLAISKSLSVSVTAAHAKAVTFFRDCVAPPPVVREYCSAPLSLPKEYSPVARVQAPQRYQRHQQGMQRQSNQQYGIEDGGRREILRSNGNHGRHLFTAKHQFWGQRERRGSSGEQESR